MYELRVLRGTRARYAEGELRHGLDRSSAAVFFVEPGMAFRPATIRAAVHHAIGRRYRDLPAGAVERLAVRPDDWPVLLTGRAALEPRSCRRYWLDGEETDPYVKLERLACVRIDLIGARYIDLQGDDAYRFGSSSLDVVRDRMADELHTRLHEEG